MINTYFLKKTHTILREPTHFQISLYCFFLVVVAISIYANSLSNGFVFDDISMIQQNPDVVNFKWERVLSLNSYRPLRTLTYALNYGLGGLDPFGYHLFNLLLHAFNSVLVFLFLRLILENINSSFLGGILFAIHPVQTASVAYISGRKDLLATFFLLLSVYWFVKWRRVGGWGRLILMGCAIFLAILSKEVAVIFPLLLLLLDLCVIRVHGVVRKTTLLAETIKAGALFYTLVLAFAVLALYYAIVWTEASRMDGYWGDNLLNQWGTSFKLFVHYLKLAFVPYPLIADYTGVFPVSTGFTEPMTLFCLLVVVLYVVFAMRFFCNWPLLTLGMGWFFISLLPVLQIVGFHEITADHFMYLPMVGVALSFGDLGARGLYSRSINVLVGTVILCVFVIFSFLTVTRNWVWVDQVTLWEDTYEKAPDSYRANANLGQIYFEHFQRDPNRNPRLRESAIKFSKRAAEISPTDSLAYSNLGVIHREWGWKDYLQGNDQKAEEQEKQALLYLNKAVSLDPENVWNQSYLGDVRKDLGMIWQGRGDLSRAKKERQAALQAYEKAIEFGSPNPQFPLIYFKLAMVKVDQRRFTEAIPWLLRSVNSSALASRWEIPFWLGFCYAAIGRIEESVPYLRRSVNIAPYPPGLRLLGYAMGWLGKTDDALSLYKEALVKNPKSFETLFLMGLAFREKGDEEKALNHLEQAFELVEKGPKKSSTEAYRRSIELALGKTSKRP